MSIRTRSVDYFDGDTAFEGLVAWDDSIDVERPGVLVAHTWGGRGKLEDGKAIRLAELGYVGFSLDLYGKGVRGETPEENSRLMQPFLDDRAMLQRRMLISLDALREQSEADAAKVAAIGFCFGGLCVLDIARTGEDLAGVASFHGLLGAPDNTAGNSIAAKVLVMHGWDDPMAPPEQVVDLAQELSGMNADWQLHAYGNTMHAFTNPNANNEEMGTVYNAVADARSWAAMENFLAEVLGS